MDKQEMSRFLEIFLRNHKQYESVIMVLHEKDHNTRLVIKALDGAPCITMIMMHDLLEQIMRQMEDKS